MIGNHQSVFDDLVRFDVSYAVEAFVAAFAFIRRRWMIQRQQQTTTMTQLKLVFLSLPTGLL